MGRLSEYILMICIFLCKLISFAQAEDKSALDICFNSYAPYSYVQEGLPTGISIDSMKEAARRAGITVNFYEMPWPRCLEGVKSGSVDGLLDAAGEHEGLTYLTAAPTPFAVGAAVKADSWVASNSDLELVEPNRALVIRGSILPEKTQQLIEGKAKEVSTIKAILRMLEMGRGDYTPVDLVTFKQLQKTTDTKLRFIVPPIETSQAAPAFHPTRSNEIAKLNNALSDMKTDGTLDHIYLRYIGITYSELTEIVSG